jgi:hypothetical protein
LDWVVEFEMAAGAGAAKERPVPLQALSSTLTATTMMGNNLVLFMVFSNKPASNAGTKNGFMTIFIHIS